MDRKEAAIAMHDKKYNCAQAVACAFAEELGADKRTVFRACEGFGRGVGAMQSICGALSGAVVCAGLQHSDGDLEDPRSKAETYKLSEAMRQRFIAKTGGLICSELKGVGTGKPLCSCPDCIRAGVEVTEEVLGL